MDGAGARESGPTGWQVPSSGSHPSQRLLHDMGLGTGEWHLDNPQSPGKLFQCKPRRKTVTAFGFSNPDLMNHCHLHPTC